MIRLTEFVLRHRKLVMLFWLVMLVVAAVVGLGAALARILYRRV